MLEKKFTPRNFLPVDMVVRENDFEVTDVPRTRKEVLAIANSIRRLRKQETVRTYAIGWVTYERVVGGGRIVGPGRKPLHPVQYDKRVQEKLIKLLLERKVQRR